MHKKLDIHNLYLEMIKSFITMEWHNGQWKKFNSIAIFSCVLLHFKHYIKCEFLPRCFDKVNTWGSQVFNLQ